MSASSVPTVQFGPNGFFPPLTSAILSGVQADFNAAFGGGLNPSLATPQGMLGTGLTANIDAANETFITIANGVDPAFATGRMQDAIGRIYFQTRQPATPTVVQANCIGLNGTVIPVGAIAVALDGNQYTCTSGGQIGIGGSVTLTFACSAVGPIACPAGQLNAIYQAIPGWDSITNPSDGVQGTNVESSSAFEERRAASVSANSSGPVAAMVGAVLQTTGVTDAYGIDNPTNSNETIGAVIVNANSVYVCVAGNFDPVAVATAIFSRKGPGASFTGATSQAVQDTNPAYSAPFPTYTIKFQTAAALPIFFAVDMAQNPGVPSNGAALVQQAVLNAFAGGDGGPRARIASTILALRFVSAIAALGPWATVRAIAVGVAAAPTGSNVVVPIDHVPTIVAGNVGVTFD